ncbi:MAG TPA: hypothetical protein VFW77_02390 [Candidatus Saccharimonadales bacterium]|nr:hypothetical protein [Candidatus Saccharimonadales bacterium]
MKRILCSLFILALIAQLTAGILRPQQAAAEVPGTDVNFLYLVGEHCHDLKDISHDFSEVKSHMGYGSRCHNDDEGFTNTNPTKEFGGKEPGWEEALKSSLGCSGNMFYQFSFKDPNDSSSTNEERWYTHVGTYKDCYNKAQNMFNNMTNTNGQCALAVDGSEHYQNCQADMQNLHLALGCSNHMVRLSDQTDTNGNPYHTVDPNDPNVKDCQKRIDSVGNTKLYVPVPGPNVQSKKMDKPISDPSITADTADPDAAGDDSGLTCGGGLSLGWIICGMTEVVGNFGEKIFSGFIQPMMENTPLSVDPSDPFYKSWQGFRLIGNILLIGSMLAIVYSQARGGGGGQ